MNTLLLFPFSLKWSHWLNRKYVFPWLLFTYNALFFFSLRFSFISTLLHSLLIFRPFQSHYLFLPFLIYFAFSLTPFPRNICHVDYPHLVFYLMLSCLYCYSCPSKFHLQFGRFFFFPLPTLSCSNYSWNPSYNCSNFIFLVFPFKPWYWLYSWARWSFYIYDKNVFQEWFYVYFDFIFLNL